MKARLQEIDSERVRRAASELADVASGTAAGYETWSPLPGGRGVIDHLINCAVANRRWASIIRERSSTSLDDDVINDTIRRCGTTIDGATDELMRAATELELAILGTDDAHLDLVISVPWWPVGRTMSVGSAFLEAVGNMAFCSGQIWNLQMMAGRRPADPPISARPQAECP